MIYREGTLDSRYPKKQTRKVDQIISNISVNTCSILFKSYNLHLIFFVQFCITRPWAQRGQRKKFQKITTSSILIARFVEK